MTRIARDQQTQNMLWSGVLLVLLVGVLQASQFNSLLVNPSLKSPLRSALASQPASHLLNVYYDIFTGDEIIDDRFPFSFRPDTNDLVVQVKTKFETITINIEDDYQTSYEFKVVDAIDAFNLHKSFAITSLNDLNRAVYRYFATLVRNLRTRNLDRAALLLRFWPTFSKFIADNHDKIEVYLPFGVNIDRKKDFEVDGSLIFAYYEDGDESPPTMLYFFDSLVKERF